jgi:hypothetical protein
MQPTRSTAVLVLAVALFVGACGSGQSTTAPPPPTTLPTTSTTVDPALPAKALAAVPQLADFPAGFTAQPNDPGQGLSVETVWAELMKCLGVDAGAQRMALATSPTFLRGLATQARGTVEYTSAPTATAIAAGLSGPKAPGCLKDAFVADVTRSKPDGSTTGTVNVAGVAPAQVAAAGTTMAWRINATVNLQDLVVPLFQDFIVNFNRGTVVRLLFLNPGSEFPQGLEKSVVANVVSRA